MNAEYWIGIDTGGTFTDLVLADASTGSAVYHKVPTRTQDPSQGILDGVAELLKLAKISAGSVSFLVLGTTLGTNAVLEGKWAKTGMLTTEGFGDLLDIARQRRPHYFNLDIPKPVPPVSRDHRMEVPGRITADGKELRPLDAAALDSAIRRLQQTGVEAVAICFLHSYLDDAQERRALERVRELWPEVYVCNSAAILPEFREYERFITTVVNASLMPVMDRYLERFEQGVKALGVPSAARVMQSNGGAVSAGAVRKQPANTFFSGPAGGVMATVALTVQTGIDKLIAFDMGGTSTDVSLVRGGQPAMKSERDMGGFPVRTRTLDIHTIGAGGGSLAWVDAGGMVKVGPKSAGAFPGPASYGRGGTAPTVTDANVLLGRLSPVSLLNGSMPMYPEKAKEAIEHELCAKTGLSAVDAAVGVLSIANVHMTGAVRVISIEQGEDPREYTLVAFGGAGPLHAVDVALAAGINQVLVPSRPGLLSAQGLLQSDQRGDFSLTRLLPATDAYLQSINAGFHELLERVNKWLEGEGIRSTEKVVRVWQLDVRYEGQNSELIVEVDHPELNAVSLAAVREQFHERHAERYGYDMRRQQVEILNLRATVRMVRRKLSTTSAPQHGEATQAITGHREVWFRQTGFIETPILDRSVLGIGCRFQGPAIVEQMDTTTVIPPGAEVSVDAAGNLLIDLRSLDGARKT